MIFNGSKICTLTKTSTLSVNSASFTSEYIIDMAIMGASNRYLIGIVTILLMICSVEGNTDFWTGNIAENIARSKENLYCPVRDMNQWVNSIILPPSVGEYFDDKFGPNGGYYATTYVRDLLTGTVIYWMSAGLWHLGIYVIWVKDIFLADKRPLPSNEIILDQMLLAQASMFLYAALPVFSGFLIENKLTKTYFYIDEIGGWGFYFAYLFIYMVCVEIGIYWMHRTLHTNKVLYKYIHSLHHKYNSAVTLTPWSSVAFHPLDGILQASPYVICLFFIPCHYLTHLLLVFFTAVWATNIHDSTWANTEPFMGSKYHLLHHTHYHYNYGQFFIFCDSFWGTLRLPEKSLLNPSKASTKIASVLNEFTNDTDNTVDVAINGQSKKVK